MQYHCHGDDREAVVTAMLGNMSPGTSSMNTFAGVESLAKLNLDSVWWINRVVVRPEHRRMGIGTKLIKHLLVHADGLSVIVAPGGYDITTKEQIAFYKSLDFVDAPIDGVLIWTPNSGDGNDAEDENRVATGIEGVKSFA
jgi:GNAT superfamily N-acetyltransferase